MKFVLAALLCLVPMANTPMAQTRTFYVAPWPDAEMDEECPNCGVVWHYRLYRDMPFKKIFSLRPGQTWTMQLLHMKYCEQSIRRILFA